MIPTGIGKLTDRERQRERKEGRVPLQVESACILVLDRGGAEWLHSQDASFLGLGGGTMSAPATSPTRLRSPSHTHSPLARSRRAGLHLVKVGLLRCAPRDYGAHCRTQQAVWRRTANGRPFRQSSRSHARGVLYVRRETLISILGSHRNLCSVLL